MEYRFDTSSNDEEIQRAMKRYVSKPSFRGLAVQGALQGTYREGRLYLQKSGKTLASMLYGFQGRVTEEKDGKRTIVGHFGYRLQAYLIMMLISAVLIGVVAVTGHMELSHVIVLFVLLTLIFWGELWLVALWSRRRYAADKEAILKFIEKRLCRPEKKKKGQEDETKDE